MDSEAERKKKAAAAQARYRERIRAAAGEALENDLAVRRKASNDYRQRKAAVGEKERTIMMTDEEHRLVLQILATVRADEGGYQGLKAMFKKYGIE